MEHETLLITFIISVTSGAIGFLYGRKQLQRHLATEALSFIIENLSVKLDMPEQVLVDILNGRVNLKATQLSEEEFDNIVKGIKDDEV